MGVQNFGHRGRVCLNMQYKSNIEQVRSILPLHKRPFEEQQARTSNKTTVVGIIKKVIALHNIYYTILYYIYV